MGFGFLHMQRPPPASHPDVVFKRFVVMVHRWDAPTWDTKTRPYHDGMACGVSAALSVGSHVDCNPLDRSVETAATFIRRWVWAGHQGGFESVVFDHDEAYQRVRRANNFRCWIPVLSPGAHVGVGSDKQMGPAGPGSVPANASPPVRGGWCCGGLWRGGPYHCAFLLCRPDDGRWRLYTATTTLGCTLTATPLRSRT